MLAGFVAPCSEPHLEGLARTQFPRRRVAEPLNDTNLMVFASLARTLTF
jgi:hypothetical protein